MMLLGGRGPGVEPLLLSPGGRDGRRCSASQHGGCGLGWAQSTASAVQVRAAVECRRAFCRRAVCRLPSAVVRSSRALSAGERQDRPEAAGGCSLRCAVGWGSGMQAARAGLSLTRSALCSCQKRRRRRRRRGFHRLLRKVITQAGLCARPVDE